jgi:translation initiation factor IF-2
MKKGEEKTSVSSTHIIIKKKVEKPQGETIHQEEKKIDKSETKPEKTESKSLKQEEVIKQDRSEKEIKDINRQTTYIVEKEKEGEKPEKLRQKEGFRTEREKSRFPKDRFPKKRFRPEDKTKIQTTKEDFPKPEEKKEFKKYKEYGWQEQINKTKQQEHKKEDHKLEENQKQIKPKEEPKEEKPQEISEKNQEVITKEEAKEKEIEEKEVEMRTEPKEETKDEIEVFGGTEFIIPFRPRYIPKDKRKFRKREKVEPRRQIIQETKTKKVKIPEAIRISDLSKITGIKASEIISKLLSYGKELTINQTISAEEAEIICAEFGIEVEREEFDESAYINLSPDPEDKLKPRPPVVVVMGHVDHGKTTLLDAIRQTKVAEQEVGGITQSIGAYTVEIDKGIITFIDTPGHEAFTEMRARGTKVADIAILVVAADEGVKPQTEEAISHAKAAGVPIIVAINKIDKPGANPQLVKSQLSQLGLIPDDWGGDTLFAEISAKKKKGIEDLLDKILIQAELLNLRANPDRPAEGIIIESSIDRGLGNVATVIVQRGTLRKGDVFVAGLVFGRIRSIFSDKGKIIKELTPGLPGRIVISSDGLPLAGDKLYVVKDEETAKKIVEERKKREVKPKSISLEEIYDKILESENKVILPLILKANTKGALDALEKEISEIQVPQLELRIIHKGIGVVSQSDINLASASKGIVIGYNIGIEKQAQNLAKIHGVQVRLYKIIYEIVDDIKKAVKGMLKPKEKEVIIGSARILKIFKLSVGRVLGCRVEKGKIQVGANARIKRNGDIVFEGKITSIKRFKDSVQEVEEGEECGILIEGLQDAKEQDTIECYNIVKEEIKID